MIAKNHTSSAKGVYIIFFFIAVHLAGCQELAPTSDDQKNQDIANLEATINQSETHDQFLQLANRHFIHLAEQIPGFGGVYLEKEGTQLVIRVTDQDQIDRTAIEDDVRNYLGKEAPIVGSAVDGGVQAMELRFEEADYEYIQLYEWQEQIAAPVLDSEGVTFISLSQRNNKIRVGIEEEGFENEIVELVKVNEVPIEAIKISVNGNIVDDRSNHSLRDMQRPLRGGLQHILYDEFGNPVHTDDSGNPLPCTVGFNVLWSDDGIFTPHWVTNSHCTRERWAVTPNDEYYQSSISDGSSGYVGFEVYDPPGFTGQLSLCMTRPCRFSDAALISNTFAIFDLGKIARTEFSSGPGQGTGSLIIDQNDPYFNIISEADDNSHYFEGLWLSKVGRTTGWTTGEITETCAHVNHHDSNVGDFRYLCQEITNYFSDGGDSGSPVHASPYGWPDVRLYGIHWGSSQTGERVFSRITGVKQDLGNMVTY